MKSALPIPAIPAMAPAMAVNIGNFAPQEKNGITRTVAVLSLSSARVLVFIIAGTEQPKPIIIGINALPESPNFLNALSSINAIRAIYPESSSMEKNRKSTRIGGRKESTAFNPSITPSLSRHIAHGDMLLSSIRVTSQPKPYSTIILFHRLFIITPGENNVPS